MGRRSRVNEKRQAADQTKKKVIGIFFIAVDIFRARRSWWILLLINTKSQSISEVSQPNLLTARKYSMAHAISQPDSSWLQGNIIFWDRLYQRDAMLNSQFDRESAPSLISAPSLRNASNNWTRMTIPQEHCDKTHTIHSHTASSGLGRVMEIDVVGDSPGKTFHQTGWVEPGANYGK
jgi:hypothetical protein